jgi:protein ImuB
LLFVLQRFVEQLARRIETIHLVVAEFQLHLGLSNGAKHRAAFKIPAPTCDVKILFRMMHTHLENVRTDATIVSLQLDATTCEPEFHQFGLQETMLRNPNQFAETLARLRALLGEENVGTPVPEATHKPDSFRLNVPEFDLANKISNLESRITNSCLRRFRPSLPARFEFREDKPSLVRSDFFSGAIMEARGPFFSSGNWWDETRWAREEWDVKTSDGFRFRIFRSNDGAFVDGMYD